MADPDAVVTDTHPLIFHAAGGGRLSRRAARLFERCEGGDALIYVPAPVIWECSLLVRVGRVNLQRPLRTFFEDLFSNPAYQALDLTPEQVFVASDLTFTHDPFDALIVASACVIGLPLVTRDVLIQESGAVTIAW